MGISPSSMPASCCRSEDIKEWFNPESMTISIKPSVHEEVQQHAASTSPIICKKDTYETNTLENNPWKEEIVRDSASEYCKGLVDNLGDTLAMQRTNDRVIDQMN